jgi:hypothetical protein
VGAWYDSVRGLYVPNRKWVWDESRQKYVEPAMPSVQRVRSGAPAPAAAPTTASSTTQGTASSGSSASPAPVGVSADDLDDYASGKFSLDAVAVPPALAAAAASMLLAGQPSVPVPVSALAVPPVVRTQSGRRRDQQAALERRLKAQQQQQQPQAVAVPSAALVAAKGGKVKGIKTFAATVDRSAKITHETFSSISRTMDLKVSHWHSTNRATHGHALACSTYTDSSSHCSVLPLTSCI